MCLTVAKGQFPYFFCTGRAFRRTACREPYVAVDEVERQLEERYKHIRFSGEMQRSVRDEMEREIAVQEADKTKRAESNLKKKARLELERDKLLKAYYADALPVELLKKEQDRIEIQLKELE